MVNEKTRVWVNANRPQTPGMVACEVKDGRLLAACQHDTA